MGTAPVILSFVSQVADALRQGLVRRRWQNRLPAEQNLAREFQVSRATLRAALRILVDEGWLETSKGRRAKILSSSQAVSGKSRMPVIGLLSPHGPREAKPFDLFQEPLFQQLTNRNFRVGLHGGSRYYRKKPDQALEELVKETRVDCWILLFSTPEMQRWFSARNLPAMIEGTAHEGIELPAVDIDYRAISRHAVGVLLAQGHTQLVLLIPPSRTGGIVRCEEGFHEGLQHHRATPVQGRVLSAHSSIGEICRTLRRVLTAKAPPTALLVAQPVDMLTVLTYLMNAGYRIPADISLICLSDAPFLENLIPAIARYALNPEVFAKQVTQLAAKVVHHRAVPKTQKLVLPSYLSGHSVGPCPING